MTKTEAFTQLRRLAQLEDEPFDLNEELLDSVIEKLDETYTYSDDSPWLTFAANDLKELAARLTTLVGAITEVDA